MSIKSHVVITGTGRAGTTFLVELLTTLGFDTGFSVNDIVSKKHKVARAGLEHDLRRENCPFVVKGFFLEEELNRDDIVIQHVFIPVRDLYAAAESRRYVTRDSISKSPFLKRLKYMIRPKRFKGGLVETHSVKQGNQERELLNLIYKLILALSNTSIPVTFMRYPRIVKDCSYLFNKLKPILKDISYEYFLAAFNKTVHPELVHSFSEEDK
ncbi:MAG: hypothetical protein JW914_08435 [Syntrophaceae bacterium]|nr:hypothetical protein [Syntrophaceae bacterium]